MSLIPVNVVSIIFNPPDSNTNWTPKLFAGVAAHPVNSTVGLIVAIPQGSTVSVIEIDPPGAVTKNRVSIVPPHVASIKRSNCIPEGKTLQLSVEIALLSWIGFILLKIMFDFGAAMEAWSELDKIMRGY